MELSITLIIIIITALVSFGGFGNQKIIDDLIFYPPAVTQRGQWYRFFTCGLIHADFGHLIFNMLSLFFFGPYVERGFTRLAGEGGKWYYLAMYITALLISLLPTYFRHRNNYAYRSLGASGAVSTVVFTALMLVPTAEVGFFFLPAIPGFVFGPLYLIITALLDRRGGDNINHSAHLWGALYGIAFIILLGRIVDYPVVANFIEQVSDYLDQRFG
jgi:membrane associated rhomboid family serine protease